MKKLPVKGSFFLNLQQIQSGIQYFMYLTECQKWPFIPETFKMLRLDKIHRVISQK